MKLIKNTTEILALFLWVITLVAGETRNSRPATAFLEMALEPPVVNTVPGPEYSDEQRDYGMTIGIERTRGGRFWAVWVAGGDSDKGYFVTATSDDEGKTWSKPRFVIDPPEAPNGLRRRILVGNFWCDPTGRLWLFFDQSMGYFDGRAGDWAITCDDPDAAQPVWSAPRRIYHGMTLNKPTVLRNGDWLLPISLWTRDRIGPAELRNSFHELDDQRMAHTFVSVDQGKTWTRRGGVIVPQSDFDEHMFVELKDGRLWMLARTKYGIADTFSPDGGRTWSEPKPSPIQNPNARFFIRRLISDRLLMVKNGPLGKRTGRSEMTAFLSDDDGKTWLGGLVLDERNGVSYPDGFQAPDGRIFISYDHNRAADREILLAVFTEEDILACRATSGKACLKGIINKAIGPTKVR
ncbi:MAG: sialidase family protein [Kiritimatiellae bacterium]|nr:sialidase family protein [Kiritimatiellia bacterium]MDD5519293.1 sialidase family protein [Kiritimatiellia bacterium]